MIEKFKEWITANKTVSIIIGAVLALFVFKKMLPAARRRRTRKKYRPVVRARVKVKRTNGSYNRIIKTGANRGKKAWQIKGSPEARRRMAALRRIRKRKLI